MKKTPVFSVVDAEAQDLSLCPEWPTELRVGS